MEPRSPDESKLCEWLREYRGILVKISRSFATEPADQNDLLQQMAVQLWQSAKRFQNQSRVSTWVYSVCFNAALTWRRTERDRRATSSLELVPELKEWSTPPDRSTEHDELLNALYQQIRALPPAERSLIILHLDGLSYSEIGAVLGASENQIGVTLTRIRKKLAESLKEVRNELR